MIKVMDIMIDMDDTLFVYEKTKQQAIQTNPEQPYPQSEQGFYATLPPIEDGAGIEAVKSLMRSKYFRPHFCTAPSVRNPLSYTEKRICIEKWFGLDMCHRLYIMPDKGRVIADVLIDNANNGHGQEKFAGELIHYGAKPYENWSTIMTHLENKTN